MRYSLLVFCSALLAQVPSNVTVELSLDGERTVYKIGEPILLRLTFTANAATSLNVTTTEPASPVDALVLSPMEGVFPWLADQNGGHPYSPDYAALASIEPGKSQVVKRPLNADRLDDWRAQWKGRAIPASEGHFEAELNQAVTRALWGRRPRLRRTPRSGSDAQADEGVGRRPGGLPHNMSVFSVTRSLNSGT